jgi:hypothetical protein
LEPRNHRRHKRPGQHRHALKFNGSPQYVVSINNASLSGNFSTTISAWIKTANAASNGCILSTGDGAVGLDDGIAVCLGFRPNGALSAEYYGNHPTQTSANPVSANAWHHIVVTKTPGPENTTTTFYVDGVLKPVASGHTDTPSFSANKVWIGNNGPGGANSLDFNGIIDDVRMYNRALSANEVSQLYLMGR